MLTEKKKKRYSEDLKQKIVDLHISGITLSKLSDEYGIAKSTIHGWVKAKAKCAINDNTFMTLKEVKVLEKELQVVRKENEILKKAIAIFTTRM